MAGEPLVGIGLAVTAAAALAGQSLAVRRSTRDQSITDLVAVMFAVNVLVLVPPVAMHHSGGFGLTITSLVAFAIGGVLGSLIARYALFVGIERLGASRAEPLKSTYPLLSVLAAWVVLGDAVAATVLVGIVVIVIGVAVLTGETQASPVTASGRQLWIDLRYPLIAAVFLGIDPVFTKVGLAEGTPALVGLTVRLLAATAGFGVYLIWRRVRDGYGVSITPTRWMLLASLANTVYLVAYFFALTTASVAVVTPIVGVSPLLVVVGAAVFMPGDEAVTRRLAVAVALIVAGVTIALVA